MEKSVKNVIGVVIIIVGLSLMFNIGFLDRRDGSDSAVDGDSKTVSVDRLKSIRIDGTSESIVIEKHDSDKVVAEISGHGKKFDNAKLVVNERGSYVEISVEYKKFNVFSTGEVNLDVKIPKDFDGELDLGLTSGSINVDDDLELDKLVMDLTSGDVNLAGVKADKSTIEITSGVIDVESLETETLNIDLGSGDLEINKFIGDLEGNVTSGKVMINYHKFDNDIKLDMTSGNFDIYLPKSAEFKIDADVTSGSVDCDFDLDKLNKDGNSYTGSVGDSKNKINVELTSGDVDIKVN